MAKSFFDNLAKETGNAFIGQFSDVDQYIDTGSYVLNALLSGSIYKGLPGNKITAFAGASSTGKTFFVLSVVKQFLDDNPDAGVMFFESESAITKDMLTERGIDPNRLIVIPVATVQEFKNQALKVVNGYLDQSSRPPMMVCLDSLGMLSTTKELADSEEGKETKDMTRPGIIRAAFRVLTLKLGAAKVPMIVTNHTYDNIGGYGDPTQISGGGGLKYAADVILTLSRRKEKEGTDVIGNVIHCKAFKSRLTKENSQVDALLRYDIGLHKYYGLTDLAVAAGIWENKSGRIILEDGSKQFGKTIYGNPEKFFTKSVLDRIDTYAQSQFLYGSANVELDA